MEGRRRVVGHQCAPLVTAPFYRRAGFGYRLNTSCDVPLPNWVVHFVKPMLDMMLNIRYPDVYQLSYVFTIKFLYIV